MGAQLELVGHVNHRESLNSGYFRSNLVCLTTVCHQSAHDPQVHNLSKVVLCRVRWRPFKFECVEKCFFVFFLFHCCFWDLSSGFVIIFVQHEEWGQLALDVPDQPVNQFKTIVSQYPLLPFAGINITNRSLT